MLASSLVLTPTCQDRQTNSGDKEILRPIMTYLPQCPNESILLTTRNKSAARELIEQRDIFTIDPMGKSDAIALFENKLGCHDNGSDTAELITALEFMPLAIVQAAAYISRRAPRCSVQEYLQDFRRSDRKRTRLPNNGSKQLRRDWEAKNSILITWQISFDYIHGIRPSATDLLSLMSFCDRQGIPKILLRNRGKQTNSLQAQCEGDQEDSIYIDVDNYDDNSDEASQFSMNDGFEEDILALRNFSFISYNTDDTNFEMHELVQLAMREWLEAHGQQEKWKKQFTKNLNTELPNGEYEDWDRCRTLFPHVQSAERQQPGE